MSKPLAELLTVIESTKRILASNTILNRRDLDGFTISQRVYAFQDVGQEFLDAHNSYLTLQSLTYLRTLDKFPMAPKESINEASPLFACKELLVEALDMEDIDPEELAKPTKRPVDLYRAIVGLRLYRNLKALIESLERKGISIVKAEDVLDFTVDVKMARDDLMRHTLLLYNFCLDVDVRMSDQFNLLIPECSEFEVDKYTGSAEETRHMFLFLKRLPVEMPLLKEKLTTKYPEVPEPALQYILDLFLQIMSKRMALSSVTGIESLNFREFHSDYFRPMGVVNLSSVRLPSLRSESMSIMRKTFESAPEELRLFSKVLEVAYANGTDEETLSPRTRAVLTR